MMGQPENESAAIGYIPYLYVVAVFALFAVTVLPAIALLFGVGFKKWLWKSIHSIPDSTDLQIHVPSLMHSNAITVCDILRKSGFSTADWESLAPRLGVKDTESILTVHPRKPFLCLNDVICQWLHSDPQASWVKLAAEVSKVQGYGPSIAQEILRNAEGDNDTSSDTTSGYSTDDNDNVDELEKSFYTLFTKTRIALSHKGTCVTDVSKYLQEMMKSALTGCDWKRMLKAKDMDSLFDLLRPHTSWANLYPLRMIIDRFGDEEDKERLHQFELTYTELYSKTPMAQLTKDQPQYVIFGKCNCLGRSKLIVKLNKDWKKFRGNELDKIRKEMASVFRIKPEDIFLCIAQPGCVKLTFTVPSAMQKNITVLSAAQEQALSELGVEEIQFGSDPSRHFPPTCRSHRSRKGRHQAKCTVSSESQSSSESESEDTRTHSKRQTGRQIKSPQLREIQPMTHGYLLRFIVALNLVVAIIALSSVITSYMGQQTLFCTKDTAHLIDLRLNSTWTGSSEAMQLDFNYAETYHWNVTISPPSVSVLEVPRGYAVIAYSELPCFTTASSRNLTSYYILEWVNRSSRIQTWPESQIEILSAKEEKSTEFICAATGDPRPTIQWIHNGEHVNMDNSYGIFHITSEMSDTMTSRVNLIRLLPTGSGKIERVTCTWKNFTILKEPNISVLSDSFEEVDFEGQQEITIEIQGIDVPFQNERFKVQVALQVNRLTTLFVPSTAEESDVYDLSEPTTPEPTTTTDQPGGLSDDVIKIIAAAVCSGIIIVILIIGALIMCIGCYWCRCHRRQKYVHQMEDEYNIIWRADVSKEAREVIRETSEGDRSPVICRITHNPPLNQSISPQEPTTHSEIATSTKDHDWYSREAAQPVSPTEASSSGEVTVLTGLQVREARTRSVAGEGETSDTENANKCETSEGDRSPVICRVTHNPPLNQINSLQEPTTRSEIATSTKDHDWYSREAAQPVSPTEASSSGEVIVLTGL